MLLSLSSSYLLLHQPQGPELEVQKLHPPPEVPPEVTKVSGSRGGKRPHLSMEDGYTYCKEHAGLNTYSRDHPWKIQSVTKIDQQMWFTFMSLSSNDRDSPLSVGPIGIGLGCAAHIWRQIPQQLGVSALSFHC